MYKSVGAECTKQKDNLWKWKSCTLEYTKAMTMQRQSKCKVKTIIICSNGMHTSQRNITKADSSALNIYKTCPTRV